MNRHGDHIASCLCCEHFEYVAETGPYSDLTPGDSAKLVCRMRVFTVHSPTGEDFHDTCVLGETCSKFSGRETD